MQSVKVEYLVIVSTSNSFCSSIKSFNNLLKSNADINIDTGKLKHKNLEVDYEVQTEQLEGKSERFYHIRLNCSDIERISEFESLLRDVREILHKTGNGYPQTLWDDVSYYYANKAYPLIHQIENLMRKLITKFMLTNVGMGWAKDNIPDEVKNSVRVANSDGIVDEASTKNKKDENSPDYLYRTDFIQLKNFLFKEYTPFAMSALTNKIKSSKDISELSFEELKSFVPKSNWERYFSKLVDCDDNYLNKRWNKLYVLRCKIAHNNQVTKTDYDQIVHLVSEVKDKLQQAIDNLDKIHISDEDKEIVAENVAGNSNDRSMDFIQAFKLLEIKLIMKSKKLSIVKSANQSPSYLSRLLKENKIISESLYEEIIYIIKHRNSFVHEHNVYFSNAQFEQLIYNIQVIMDELGSDENDFPK